MRRQLNKHANIMDSKRVISSSLKNIRQPDHAFPFDKYDLFETEADYKRKKKEQKEKKTTEDME
jgi:hypothetical protein